MSASILAQALAQGGKVIWDHPGKPRLLVPRDLRPRVEANLEAVRTIMKRAVVFREQAQGFIREGRHLPILALPDRPEGGGCCSCGAPIETRRYRCEVCALAVALALEGALPPGAGGSGGPER